MLDQKSEVSKRFKKSNFPKGLVHGFCPKIELFTIRFFRHPKAEKSVFLIFWIEKNTLQLRKGKFQKCPQNWIFHRGQSLFLSKNRAFYDVVFQAPQGKKECFIFQRGQSMFFVSFLLCGFFRETEAEKIVFFFKFWIGNTFQSRKVNFQKYLKKRNFLKG